MCKVFAYKIGDRKSRSLLELAGVINVNPPNNASLGVYTYGGLLGPLVGKPVTALDNVVKSKNAYVTVRTLVHQSGASRTNTSN
jgi:hypothetical protein